MDLTVLERQYKNKIVENLKALRKLLNELPLYSESSTETLFEQVSLFKLTQGNINNASSFLAVLLAKRYLCSKLALKPFDCAEKPQGAPGLDLDLTTEDGRRLIAEVKTTEPYMRNDLGAQQRATFLRDFDKLNNTSADLKYFFVSEHRTFDLMKRKYAQKIPGVIVVLVTTGEEVLSPAGATA